MLSVNKIVPSCSTQCGYIGSTQDLGSASGVEVVGLHSREGFTEALGNQ